MTKLKIDKIILILVLLAFSVEYIGGDGLSVYRLIIFPLSCIGIMRFCFVKKSQRSMRSVPITILFMLYYALCILLFSTDANILFPIFCIPFMCYIEMCVASGLLYSVNVGRIFSLYSLPHLYAFLRPTVDTYIDDGRFNGLHEDANFCGLFLTISLVSSLLLLRYKDRNIYWIAFDIVNVSMTSFMLFLTGSRGALLSMALIGVLLFLVSNLSKAQKGFIIVLLCIGFFYLNSYIESLPSYISPEVSYTDFALTRFKPENMEGGSNRTYLWELSFREILKDPIFPPRKSNLPGKDDFTTHNTYIELMIYLGFIPAFTIIFLYTIMLSKKSFFILKELDSETPSIMLSCLLLLLSQLFFLSAQTQKILWLFIAFMLAYNQRYYNMYKRIFVDNKNVNNYID